MTISKTSHDSEQTSTFGPFSHVSDMEKRRYHQQLVLLLHAYKCQSDSTNGEARGECNLAQCQGMQNLLSHIQVCQAGNACHIPNCASSKALILHWKNCTQRECALCLPLREASGQRQLRRLVHADQGVNQLLASGSGEVNLSHLQNRLSQTVKQITVQLQSNALVSNTSPAAHLNLSESESSVSSQMSSLIPNIIPCAPTNVKDWHQSVPSDLRQHLIERIIKEVLIILDKKNLNDSNDPASINIVTYARRNEAVMYDSANTRDEYYHLLAEKIYKIQRRELSDKCQRLREISRSQVGAVPEANVHPFFNVSDMEKRRYHQQLVLLLHAYKCRNRDSASGEVRECSLVQCPGMQCVMNHIQACQAGSTCDTANCVSSKALIVHWKNCNDAECALCLPIKEAHEHIEQLL